MRQIKSFLSIFLTVLIISCHTDEKGKSHAYSAEENVRMVTFKGREIDLNPFVEGFPYRSFVPVYEAGKLFYMKRGETTEFLQLDLKGDTNLENGQKISNIDYSTRNVWSIRYNKNDKLLYWIGDESNDEVFNLTRLNPETQQIEKLTDVPYVYGYRWNEADSTVAYVARLGTKEKRLGELRILDLKTKEEKKVVKDSPEMRFTWGSPSWQPQGKGVVVSASKNADRTLGNLVYINIETKKETLLTDPDKERSTPRAYSDWLDENTFLYTSNEDGFSNVYIYHLDKMKSQQLTAFKTDLGTSKILTIEGKKYLFATTSSPIETQIYLLSLPDGKVVLHKNSDVALSVYDAQENRILVSATSNTSMFRIDEINISTDEFEFSTVVDVPEDLKSQIYNTDVERITYPTFDIDPSTGEARQIHAYLYKPKNPLPEKDRIVMIQSFYGGGNSFNIRYQILASAGIYVLSPSPRGSSGFGKDFAALNDKDLGGNEIIDIFYAAKYISEKFNIPPSNIGVFGGSHGGYATMRTLSFPKEVNGNKIEFDWGFGLSHAGFSDIIHFYENCNIPDWVILEAGDPVTEADKLKDRSPLYHADLMKGHLLLTHGTNDSRVPIAGSEMMADSLNKYDKNVKFVKFEGQGHGIKGLNNTIIFYQTWFDFLEEVTQ